MRVKEEEYDGRKTQRTCFRKTYRQVLDEKNRLIDNYRHLSSYVEDMTALRDDIETKKEEALEPLMRFFWPTSTN